MFIVVDLLFILLLGVSIYFAGKKGFVAQLRGLAVLILAVLVAFWGNAALAGIVKDTTVGNAIYGKVETSVGGLLGITPETDDAVAETLIQNENNTISAIDSLTPSDLVGDLRQQISDGANNLAQSLLTALSDAVTWVLLRVLAFIVIFVLSLLLLYLFLWILEKATKKEGFAGNVNMALGLLFGTLRGLILCVVAGNLGEWLIRSIGATKGWDVAALLAQTYLFRFFSNIFVFL